MDSAEPYFYDNIILRISNERVYVDEVRLRWFESLLFTMRAAMDMVMTALCFWVDAATILMVSQRTACHIIWAPDKETLYEILTLHRYSHIMIIIFTRKKITVNNCMSNITTCACKQSSEHTHIHTQTK